MNRLLELAGCRSRRQQTHPGQANRPPEAYYRDINNGLAQGRGRTTMLLDMDALDHNVRTIRSLVNPDVSIRISTKSVASLELIEYLMNALRTDRLMAFTSPVLFQLLKRFRDKADYLLGVPFTVQNLTSTLDEITKLDKSLLLIALSRVQWLVDSQSKLEQYLKLARERNVRLRISLEVDVGLHRGGFDSRKSTLQALGTIQQNKQFLQFSGFMGYEAHSLANPLRGLQGDSAVVGSVSASIRLYSTLVEDALAYLGAEASGFTFNSAGSSTFAVFSKLTNCPVNDITVGSCFLLPEHFDKAISADSLRPATIMAAPVIKDMTGGRAVVPFVDLLFWAMSKVVPSYRYSYYIQGFLGPAVPLYPQMAPNPFMPFTGGKNLLPTQALIHSKQPLALDSFVLFRPSEGDLITGFESVQLFRSKKDGIEFMGQWQTLRCGL